MPTTDQINPTSAISAEDYADRVIEAMTPGELATQLEGGSFGDLRRDLEHEFYIAVGRRECRMI